MKLSTGKVAFPIEFDNGDKAVIYFNPNDREIQTRIQGFEKSIENRIKNIDIEKYRVAFDDGNNFEIDLDKPETLLAMSDEDLSSFQNKFRAIKEIESEYSNAIKEEIDIVFNSKISDAVFRYCAPFDIVIVQDDNGNQKREVYVMHFLHWLMVEMKKYWLENKSAMDKHLSKYAK